MTALHILQQILLVQETRFLGKNYTLDKRSGYEGLQEAGKGEKAGASISQPLHPPEWAPNLDWLLQSLLVAADCLLISWVVVKLLCSRHSAQCLVILEITPIQDLGWMTLLLPPRTEDAENMDSLPHLEPRRE